MIVHDGFIEVSSENEGLILPRNYVSSLALKETEHAIKHVKDTFEVELATRLNLCRVSAPLFVRANSGLNDNLNGIERPVSFDIPAVPVDAQIVQSLAKWKRLALKKYAFTPEEGLYTDMNAIRRDEHLDNLHSVYVDQWDWEVVITEEERNVETLKKLANGAYTAIKVTEESICTKYASIKPYLPQNLTFVTSQELEDQFPNLTPKQREDEICKEYGAVFISQIGGKLTSGKPHDGRAPDYDDWRLNGDILVYYPMLGRAVELSSMGIRVDIEALHNQLKEANCEERLSLPFHRSLASGSLPLTAGGGIGQSRLCLVLLDKVHIGEVQSSIWPQIMRTACESAGVYLL